MNVLSLFDGMSCGQIALRECGISFDKYFASEVDKHAMAQTQLNFPDTIQLGDVRDIDVSVLPTIDLLIGGSPCQSFSFAGKRNGMTTVEQEEVTTLERYMELKAHDFQFEGQSYLFWEYVRILRTLQKCNPNLLFLLENVMMPTRWEHLISQTLGIAPIKIDSALVSAQRRKRLYWTNINARKEGLFGNLVPNIPQPTDRGVLLKDILEAEVDEKYYLKPNVVKGLLAHMQRHIQKGNRFGAIFHEVNEKMSAIRVGGKGMYDLIIQRSRGKNEGGVFVEKSPTLSANAWEQNNVVISGTYRTHKVDGGFREIKSGKAATIPARAREDDSGQNVVLIGNRIRRLTLTECARLQTVPTWYQWACSDTQAYKMLGNGWTIDVIKHIVSHINK